MSKQTAVEWLVEKIENNVHHTIRIPREIIDQAEAMERKQTEESMAHAITFGWELSHYHRDKEPEVLLKMQKDFITCVIKGGDK